MEKYHVTWCRSPQKATGKSRDTERVELSEIFKYIKAPRDGLKIAIEKVRNESDKIKRNELKKELSCFSLAEFKDCNCTNKDFIQTKAMLIDIDNIDNVEQFKKDTCQHEFVYACFVSPSGNGVKVIVPLSTYIHDKLHYRSVYMYIGKILSSNIDDSTHDPRRLCFMSIDPEIYINMNAKPYDISKIPRDYFTTIKSSGKSPRKRRKAKDSISRKENKAGGEDRSLQAYNFIINHLALEERLLLSQAKNRRWFDHYKDDNHFREDVRRIKRKLNFDELIKPKTPYDKTSYDTEPSEEVKRMFERFKHNFYAPGNPRVLNTLGVLEQLYLDKKKRIVEIACGNGKTTAAMVVTATYASPENRILFVTEKIESVKSIAETLRNLGVNAIEWHGHSEDLCHLKFDEYRKMKLNKINPCIECNNPCTAKHRNTAKDIFDSPAHDVLITTHNFFLTMLSTQKLGNFSHIYIDEEIVNYEFLTLNDDRWHLIERKLNDGGESYRAITRFIGNAKNLLCAGDCKRIPTMSLDISRLFRSLHGQYANGVIDYYEYSDIMNFLNFFQAEKIFGMLIYKFPKKKRGAQYWFIRNKVKFNTDIPCTILDGSAMMSDVEYDGFQIVKDCFNKTSYPNTQLYSIAANPSQNILSNNEFINDHYIPTLDKMLDSNQISNVCLFRNKDLTTKKSLQNNINKIKHKLKSKNMECKEVTFGKHKGSNFVNDCDGAVIAMGLFRPAPFYCLKAALATDSEISASRIWKTLFETPAMPKSGGFSDVEINRVFIRTLAVDVYQSIMRGAIRNNAKHDYSALLIVPGIQIISILKEYLPGAKFINEDDLIVSQIEKGVSKSCLEKQLNNKNKNNASDRIRKMIDAFLLKRTA